MSIYFNNRSNRFDNVIAQTERNTLIINELARRKNISKAEKGKKRKRKSKNKGKHRKKKGLKDEITIDNQPTQQVKGYSVVNVISAKRGPYKKRGRGDMGMGGAQPIGNFNYRGKKGSFGKGDKSSYDLSQYTGLVKGASDDRYKGDPKQAEQLKGLRKSVDRIEARLNGMGNNPAQNNAAGPLGAAANPVAAASGGGAGGGAAAPPPSNFGGGGGGGRGGGGGGGSGGKGKGKGKGGAQPPAPPSPTPFVRGPRKANKPPTPRVETLAEELSRKGIGKKGFSASSLASGLRADKAKERALKDARRGTPQSRLPSPIPKFSPEDKNRAAAALRQRFTEEGIDYKNPRISPRTLDASSDAIGIGISGGVSVRSSQKSRTGDTESEASPRGLPSPRADRAEKQFVDRLNPNQLRGSSIRDSIERGNRKGNYSLPSTPFDEPFARSEEVIGLAEKYISPRDIGEEIGQQPEPEGLGPTYDESGKAVRVKGVSVKRSKVPLATPRANNSNRYGNIKGKKLKNPLSKPEGHQEARNELSQIATEIFNSGKLPDSAFRQKGGKPEVKIQADGTKGYNLKTTYIKHEKTLKDLNPLMSPTEKDRIIALLSKHKAVSTTKLSNVKEFKSKSVAEEPSVEEPYETPPPPAFDDEEDSGAGVGGMIGAVAAGSAQLAANVAGGIAGGIASQLPSASDVGYAAGSVVAGIAGAGLRAAGGAAASLLSPRLAVPSVEDD